MGDLSVIAWDDEDFDMWSCRMWEGEVAPKDTTLENPAAYCQGKSHRRKLNA